MVVVLVTKGKREDIDDVCIRIFDTELDAKSFIKEVDTGPKKYWTKAQIVEDNQSVDPLYDWV